MVKNNFAPIVMFVYSRFWHTCQTIEALQKNVLADESELFIFSDAPKNDEDVIKVAEVRKYIESIGGFKNVTVIKRSENFGLAKNIIEGVTEIVNKYGKIIVLEDDIVTSSYFLKYMNDALEIYKNEPRVMHISGYTPEISTDDLPETYFIRFPSSWGWATWDRAWKFFKKDISVFHDFSRQEIRAFNLDGAEDFWSQLKWNKKGKINTWGIFWYVSVFKQNGVCCYPAQSLVRNIGFDNTGVHCNRTNVYNINLRLESITTFESRIVENRHALKHLRQFYLSIKPSICERIIRKVRKLCKFFI